MPSKGGPMFGLFRKRSPADKLEKRYRILLEEAHRLGTSDRKASDLKRAEAEDVLRQLEALRNGSQHS